MGIFQKLFGSKKTDEEVLIEEGLCPNCWGKQEYEGKFVDFVKDNTKANINHDASQQKAFIAQFAETHVTGVKLRKEAGKSECPACRASYKH